MSYNFTLQDMSEFMSCSQNSKEFSLILPNNFGSMTCKKEIINEDIYLFKTHAKANKNLSLESNLKVDSLFINIILEGKIKYKSNHKDKIETFRKNDTYIKYIDEYNSTTILDKDDFSKGLAISIKNDFLEKNLSSEFCLLGELKKSTNINSSTFIHKKDTQINIKLANELFNSPFLWRVT